MSMAVSKSLPFASGALLNSFPCSTHSHAEASPALTSPQQQQQRPTRPVPLLTLACIYLPQNFFVSRQILHQVNHGHIAVLLEIAAKSDPFRFREVENNLGEPVCLIVCASLHSTPLACSRTLTNSVSIPQISLHSTRTQLQVLVPLQRR